MKPNHVNETIFVPSPAPGTSVMGGSYYTRPSGVEMMSMHVYSSRSDIVSDEFYRFSTDNGRTWTEPEARPARRQTPQGTLERHARFGWVDPGSGRFIRFRNEAVLPNDEVLEFMRYNTIHYAVSVDGGRTDLYDVPLVQSGEGFDADHPLSNVTRGSNSFMLGDATCVPITLEDGAILLPIQISPVGPDGLYQNKGGGYTYTDCAVLRGRWREDGRLDWRLAGMCYGDPERTTRGLIEPTLARLPGGRIIMVARGSNDRRPELPGYRWWSTSDDDGESFAEARPWTYTDGTPFYSPSSCSQLLQLGSGDIYWIGNICKENPTGNLPRYPIVIGRVDPDSGLLIADSVTIIDDHRPEDGEWLTLSNFHAREDRESHTIKLHLMRGIKDSVGHSGNCMLYEIAVQ